MKSTKGHDITSVDERAIRAHARQIRKSKNGKITKNDALHEARKREALRLENYRRLRQTDHEA